MNKWFDMDNKSFRILARITDLVVLNIVFIVTSIPIVTIGAACAALNEATDKIVELEESYIIKDYFQSFKNHFVSATKLWLLLIVIASVFVADFQILDQMLFTGKSIFVGMLYGFGFIYLFILPCAFYGKCQIKETFIMAMRYPLKTLLMAVIMYLPGMWFFAFPATVSALLCFMILAGFAVIAYLKSHVKRDKMHVPTSTI